MFCLLFRKFPYRISSDVLNILYSRCLFQCVVFNEQRRKCVNIYDLRVIRRFLLRTTRCFLFCRKHEVFMTYYVVILFRMTVEIKGFEPLTPCLQGRCSPN